MSRGLRRAGVVLSLLTVGAALAACGGAGATASKDAIKVEATDTACAPASSDLTAGKVSFAVHNGGSKTTELYVFGDGEKTIGEVENIGPGTARTLTVQLPAGHYQLECRPGQTGRGIRTDVHASAAAGAAAAGHEHDHMSGTALAVVAKDFDYSGLDGFTAKAGTTVDVSMVNRGAAQHELEIKGPDGVTVGEVAPIDPGQQGSASIPLLKAGRYTYRCGIDGHEGLGMKGSFTVTP